MLHAKFYGHWSTGSGKVLKIFNIYGRGGHIGHMTWTVDSLNIFLFLKATYEIWLQ